MEQQPWYFGRISRERAEDLLLHGREGEFLVRDSESNVSIFWNFSNGVFPNSRKLSTIPSNFRNANFRSCKSWLRSCGILKLFKQLPKLVKYSHKVANIGFKTKIDE